MRFEPELFKDINLIDDELTKINETWCEMVHAVKLHPRHATKVQATKELSECHDDIRDHGDRQYAYLTERLELFRQKRVTIYNLHSQFKIILDRLSRKERMVKRDASNFFKAVFGIPSSNDYKNLVNNLNLLKNSHNSLINDTRKLAGGLNLTHLVLKKHQGELDKLRTSLVGFQTRLSATDDALINLLEQNGVAYVLLHVDYLLDRLTECEAVFRSQITRLRDVFSVMIHGRINPMLVNPEDMVSVLDEIIKKIPENLQLSFENDFNIWHIYKYSVTTVILHGHEIHLVISIPLADRDTPVSLVKSYDIPVPLTRNVTDNADKEIFAQYDLQTKHMAISGGYLKDLTKTEYDDCIYAAGCFCTALTHMVTIDHAESCLFTLYEGSENNIRKFCSVRFAERHLPYVQALTESQWYIAMHGSLELAVTCPRRRFRKVLLPPFSVFSLPKFCMGFSAQVKLFPMKQSLGTVDRTLQIFEAHLVSRGSKVDYRIFNNFSPRDIKVIHRRVRKLPDETDGISVSLDSEIIGDLQYPESKEFLSSLKSFSLFKSTVKNVLISAASITGVVTFVLALWWMHVFALVWSGLGHCRRHEDESGPTARYQPGGSQEVELRFDGSTGTTTSHVTNTSDTNTNQLITIDTTLENSNIRASKLLELCQAKIDSLAYQD